MIIKNGQYTVYQHINKTNGKIYVGITKQKVEYRWKNGNAYKGNPLFYAAINKYGWDGFEHVVFASNLTKDEAFNMEKTLIEKLKTQDKHCGYNITGGGDTPITHNDYVRSKISKAVSGEKHPCYGKHLSEETRRKISKSEKGKKAKPTNAKPIICVETNTMYPSTAEAARSIGINHAAITNALRGKSERAKGFHWKYADVS